jgi:oligopeptide/dipeptide ABC transporter ATP-binding protein
MSDPLLAAHGLSKSYRARGTELRRRRALDGVTISVAAASSLGVVGESGSGKSTLARLLVALEPPDAGSVRFAGKDLGRLNPEALRRLRRRFQIVFQDPLSSLNPRMRVADIIAEPLRAHRLGAPPLQRQRVEELLAVVGLDPACAHYFPASFSGGERQRIAIARALACQPELLVLDEPVSSLDASIRSGVLGLIRDLRQRLALTLVLISHDLDVVRETTDQMTVLYRGRVLEEGPTDRVLGQPLHPYTAILLACKPQPRPDWDPPELTRADAPVDNTARWTGCPYASRCRYRDDPCSRPQRLQESDGGRRHACGLQPLG